MRARPGNVTDRLVVSRQIFKGALSSATFVIAAWVEDEARQGSVIEAIKASLAKRSKVGVISLRNFPTCIDRAPPFGGEGSYEPWRCVARIPGTVFHDTAIPDKHYASEMALAPGKKLCLEVSKNLNQGN